MACILCANKDLDVSRLGTVAGACFFCVDKLVLAARMEKFPVPTPKTYTLIELERLAYVHRGKDKGPCYTENFLHDLKEEEGKHPCSTCGTPHSSTMGTKPGTCEGYLHDFRGCGMGIDVDGDFFSAWCARCRKEFKIRPKKGI